MSETKQASSEAVEAARCFQEYESSWELDSPSQRELERFIQSAIDAALLRQGSQISASADNTDWLKCVELAILANGGEEWHQEACRCDPDVGAVPCEYCAIHWALKKTAQGLKENEVALRQQGEKEKWFAVPWRDNAGVITTSYDILEGGTVRTKDNLICADLLKDEVERIVAAHNSLPPAETLRTSNKDAASQRNTEAVE